MIPRGKQVLFRYVLDWTSVAFKRFNSVKWRRASVGFRPSSSQKHFILGLGNRTDSLHDIANLVNNPPLLHNDFKSLEVPTFL